MFTLPLPLADWLMMFVLLLMCLRASCCTENLTEFDVRNPDVASGSKPDVMWRELPALKSVTCKSVTENCTEADAPLTCLQHTSITCQTHLNTSVSHLQHACITLLSHLQHASTCLQHTCITPPPGFHTPPRCNQHSSGTPLTSTGQC